MSSASTWPSHVDRGPTMSRPPASPLPWLALLPAVVIEPLAGLPTELPGHHHSLEQRRRGVAGFPVLVEHDLRHVHGGIEAHQVEQGERAHRVAAAELHGLVDVFKR